MRGVKLTAGSNPALSAKKENPRKQLRGFCFLRVWTGEKPRPGLVRNSPGDCFWTRVARGRSPEKFASDEFRVIPPGFALKRHQALLCFTNAMAEPISAETSLILPGTINVVVASAATLP